jgi:hypothetical protein
VKPDVVFAFFGYNESFENKPADFKKQLIEFVKKTRGTKPNGKSFPRIVLFSPIAHEDTGNRERARWQGAQRTARSLHEGHRGRAKEAGVAFVDLFHPSLELFKAAKEPLTINGVHLTR